MSFALGLKRMRLEKGLSQAALARLSAMAQPNLAAMEQSRRQPTLATLARLAEALGCSQAALLGEGSQTPLGRLDQDELCRRLVAAKTAPQDFDLKVWGDLQAVFHDKLKAMAPALPRRRPRISARAAQGRLHARLGLEGFRAVVGRLEKAYPQ